IVVKTKLPGRWLLDNIASLPMVFPGIVLGLAIMILYLYLPVGVYGTLWIMLIAYITRFMPLPALQHHVDAANPQGAGGIRRDKRSELGDDLPPRHPAAAQARADR